MIDNESDYIIQLDFDMLVEAVLMLEKIKEKHPSAIIRIEVVVEP